MILIIWFSNMISMFAWKTLLAVGVCVRMYVCVCVFVCYHYGVVRCCKSAQHIPQLTQAMIEPKRKFKRIWRHKQKKQPMLFLRYYQNVT